jgi:hypothetical protein
VESGEIKTFFREFRMEIVSEKDSGPYDAIWKGFRINPGNSEDWMGWINSDDILNPGALAVLAEIDMQKDGKNDICWITGRTNVIDDGSGLTLACGEKKYNQYAISKGLCDGMHWSFIQQEGSFFKRKLWDSINNEKEFREFKYAGDWNLWRVFAKYAEIHTAPWSTGSFFKHEEQLSNRKRLIYDAEINMTLPFLDRFKSLLAMRDQDTQGNSLCVNYMNGRIYTIKDKHLEFANRYKKDSEIRVVKTLQDEDHDATLTLEQAPGSHFLYTEDSWQYPAITEKHAAHKLSNILTPCGNQAYLAFPWATLFDNMGAKKEKSHILTSTLGMLKKSTEGRSKVITVCQHISLEKFHEVLELAGVTDVFWSHSKVGQQKIGNLNIHPFPLYPVHVTSPAEKKHLFSFVGASCTNPCRQKIIALFSGQKYAKIIERNSWHYKKIVYGNQIKNITAGMCDKNDPEIISKEKEYLDVLSSSTFSLCPAGSGPNSIRLWESVESGSIPVIISDNHVLPGDADLWRNSVVFIKEDSLRQVPEILNRIAENKDLMEKMRGNLACIKTIYGRNSFVTDVVNYWNGGTLGIVNVIDHAR